MTTALRQDEISAGALIHSLGSGAGGITMDIEKTEAADCFTGSGKRLLHSLKMAENTVSDMQVNYHFFFNTLNEMASTALEGGNLDLYQSIIHLSRMFHYSVRTQGDLVTLKSELNYVESYLQLQKFRYKNALEFYFDVDDRVQNTIVPFNFLQPLTDNAFVHGCEEQEKKHMEIQVRDKKENVEIRIINKGKTLPEKECMWINEGMKADEGHSLGMVYRKLETFYGKNFSMKLYTKENETIFYVRIPRS